MRNAIGSAPSTTTAVCNLWNADARALPTADESVQLVVTSPPTPHCEACHRLPPSDTLLGNFAEESSNADDLWRIP